MRGLKHLAALIVAGICLAGAAAAQTAPVEAFGRLPAIDSAAISPDGAKVALLRFEGDAGGVFVTDIDRGQTLFSARAGENQQLRGVGWADDQRVTFDVSITIQPRSVLPPGVYVRGNPRRMQYARAGVVNLANNEMRYLSASGDEGWTDQGSPVMAPIEGDPGYGRIFGWSAQFSPRSREVYRINLDNGRAQNMRVAGSNLDTLYYVLDERGNVAIRADSRERSNRWRIFTYDGETPRLLLEDVSETGAPINVVGLLPDNRLAILDWDDTGEHQMMIAVDRANAAREILFQRDGGGVSGAINDPWTGHVIGATWVVDHVEQRFFDAELQAISERVAQRFAGVAAIRSWSRDRRRFIVYAENGLDGGGYYLFEPATDRLVVLGMSYPELARGMGAMSRQAITYPARDGVRIPAYLTLPPGAEQARNAPLVLLVHGGPHARDTFDFDWWAAFLASRGYVVLQPNFRGSGGYGRAWREAGRRQWGGLMQTDVEDGVAALIRSGRVDPARVCIMGASYGGYAALAGATLTPDRYRCAVGVNGVYDLVEFSMQRQRMYGAESVNADVWTLSIGDPRRDRDRLMATSPANLAERVGAPVLLIHGTDDTVVPIQQSRDMERRLRTAGKQVRLVELVGDDHWLSDAPTRISMLREIESFLSQHLTPTAAPAAP